MPVTWYGPPPGGSAGPNPTVTMPEAARAGRSMQALLVVSAAMPLVLFVAISWYLHGERLAEGEANVAQTVAVLEENALRVFEAQQLIIDRVDQYIAGMGWEEIRNSEAVHRFLRRAADASPHVDGLWLVPPGGISASSADFFPMPPVDASDRDYYRTLEQRDELHFGEMIVGRTKGTLNFNISRRRSPRETFDGLILVTASLAYFMDYWESVSPYPDHVAALIRPDGEVLARYPAPDGVPARLPSDAPLIAAMADSDSGIVDARSGIDGTELIYGYSRVGNYPVFVAFGVGRSDVLAPWRQDLLQHALVALSASVLLSGISLVAMRQTRRLGAAMQSWRESARQLRLEADRRERAEDIVAEKERLLGEVGAVTAERKAILDSMLEGVVAYRATGEVIYSNQASRRILRLRGDTQPSLDRMAREGRLASDMGEPLAETATPVARLMRGDTLTQEDLRISFGDGDETVCRFSGAPLRDGNGRVTGAVLTFADVTEEKASAQRRTLLMNELDHRVRNMLATISAMVRLSSKGAPDKDALVSILSGRIGAMTRTHGLLTRNSWRGAVLREIVRDEVQPYASPDRLVMEGDDEVVLPPQDAVDFALVVHELATNAAKYGAWSGAEGRVEVRWRVADGGRPIVHVTWRERGGPTVRPPSRTGFGSALIRSAFRRGEGAGVDLRHEPGGVTCEIRVPLRAGPSFAPLAGSAAATPAPAEAQALSGVDVLLVEDEAVVRLELAEALAAAGARVIGPASTVGEGMEIVSRRRPDAAVLDINLGGETVGPLAERLVARNVPVVFTTGYGSLDLLPPALRQLPLLQKPVRPDELIAILATRANRTAARAATRPGVV